MKPLYAIQEYVDDVRSVTRLTLPWERLQHKTLMITGGTGMIGSFLIDVLLEADLDCHVVLLGRSEEKARKRFVQRHWSGGRLSFLRLETGGEKLPLAGRKIDGIFHLASNTHPVAYAEDPVGTILTNVVLLNSLLSAFANQSGPVDRFLFASSNEVYGENRGDVELFDENYSGYIDCNTLRAGYPESKRCGEALCQAYIRQRGIDCVIARATRTYGPTALQSDTKASSQFFRDALIGRDIVLKSEGRQHYSYQYVADTVAGLLTVYLCGSCGQAYNIADETGDITLRDFAQTVAAWVGRRVVFELPNAVESLGFSKATKSRLCGNKLKALGWNPRYNIRSGIARNLDILSKLRGE